MSNRQGASKQGGGKQTGGQGTKPPSKPVAPKPPSDSSVSNIMEALNLDPTNEEAKKEYQQLIENQKRFEKDFPEEFKKNELTDTVRQELMSRTSKLKPEDYPYAIYKSLFAIGGKGNAQHKAVTLDGMVEYFHLRNISEKFTKLSGKQNQHVTTIPVHHQETKSAEKELKPPQQDSKTQQNDDKLGRSTPQGSSSPAPQKKKNPDAVDGPPGGEKARVIYKEIVIIPEGHMLVKTTDYHKLQIDLRNSRESVEELSSRLSAIASSKLKEGNPNIADLSDKNRPTKIGEQFGALYDDEWSEAFEHLSSGDESEDDKAIQFLLKILKETCLFCAQVSHIQMYHLAEVLRDTVVRPYIPDIDDETHPAIKTDEPSEENIKSAYPIGQKFAKDLRKAGAMYSMDALKQVYRDKVLKGILKQDLEKLHPTILAYAEKCFQLLWLMGVQDPPMEIRWAMEDERVDVNYFKFYQSKGKYVKLSVWPAVFLCNGGAIISKGYVVGGAAPPPKEEGEGAAAAPAK